MTEKQKNEWSEPYLRNDLSEKEHDRLVAELEADPQLLRELLQVKSPEDEELSAALLFNEFSGSAQNRLDDQMRRYLLHDPTFGDEEIAQLEELMLDDERYFERMSLVESEIIEDYLGGGLTRDEEQRFNSFFLITPERREKLKLIKALIPKISVEQLPELEPTAFSWWQSVLAFMRSPSLFAGAAAVLLFFIIGIMVFIIGIIWWFSRSAERQDPFIAIVPANEAKSNLNQPNNSSQPSNIIKNNNVSRTTPTPTNIIENNNVSPATPTPTPKSPQNNQGRKQDENPKPTPVVSPTVKAPRSVVFALFAGVPRGEGNAVEKKIEPGAKIVVLQLRLDLERDYEEFRVVVQNSDGNEVGRREKLKSTKKSSLPTVAAAFPAASFKPDDYTVILSGGTKGEYQEISRYSFRVLK